MTLLQTFSRQRHDLEIRLSRASKAFEAPGAPDALGGRLLSKDYGPVEFCSKKFNAYEKFLHTAPTYLLVQYGATPPSRLAYLTLSRRLPLRHAPRAIRS